MKIVHELLIRLIFAGLVKEPNRRLQTNSIDRPPTFAFQDSVGVVQC